MPQYPQLAREMGAFSAVRPPRPSSGFERPSSTKFLLSLFRGFLQLHQAHPCALKDRIVPTCRWRFPSRHRCFVLLVYHVKRRGAWERLSQIVLPQARHQRRPQAVSSEHALHPREGKVPRGSKGPLPLETKDPVDATWHVQCHHRPTFSNRIEPTTVS